jgi:hypothetical protein
VKRISPAFAAASAGEWCGDDLDPREFTIALAPCSNASFVAPRRSED